MPIILPKDYEDEWIDPHVKAPIDAREFLYSIETEDLKAYPVGTHVNAARNNDPSCIEPIV